VAGPLSAPPSGEQHELRHGDQRAVIAAVGACLREYRSGARELIDGFAIGEHADGGRGQALIPWPNRIRDGRYDWDGERHQLDVSEVPRANAIHGLLRWREWRPADRGPSHVTLRERVFPMPGYPFTLAVEVDYRLDDAGLQCTTRATNVGARACPYGAGFHPYLSLGGPIDEALLTVPAARRLTLDERAIPTGSEALDGSPFDFRTARAIGGLAFDDCYCDLSRDGDGRARVTLAAPGGAGRVALWLGEAYGYLMLYSGDTLAPARRRRGLAVEPMTCAPNAFVSGEGVVRLEPGDTHAAVWGIEP
jgi:aldose 1-epimerase